MWWSHRSHARVVLWLAMAGWSVVALQGCCETSISTAVVPDGCVGDYYIYALRGDCADNNWVVTSGDLPPGIELSNSGVLSGTPTLEGIYLFTVTLSPDFDPASKGFSMMIHEADAPECTEQLDDEGEYP